MGTILQRIPSSFPTPACTDRDWLEESKGGPTNGDNYTARRPKCSVPLGMGDL